MRTFIPLLLAGFLFISASFPRDIYIDERTSTEIVFAVKENMFPRHWYSKKINAEVEPLVREERQRVINILARAFLKYPEELLKVNLDRVYILKKMNFYGVPYGGTNSKNTIYLADDETNSGFTDSYIEGVFHHELSSILLRSHPGIFNMSAWQAINSPSFVYGNGGVEAILNGESSMRFDPELFERGFLTRYSQASPEEDINVFAQNLFTGGISFWNIVDENIRIRKKANMLIRFYQSIDPTLTEEYFRDIDMRFAQN